MYDIYNFHSTFTTALFKTAKRLLFPTTENEKFGQSYNASRFISLLVNDYLQILCSF